MTGRTLLDARQRIEGQVDVAPDGIVATVADARPESRTLFEALEEEERGRLAAEAWRIGLHALQNAYAQADQHRLRDIGGELMGALKEHLERHIAQQEKSVATVLQAYFDPKDGKVTERLQAFIRDDGDLARIMKQYLAPENSVMAATLARSVGETSPIFKRLSPTDSEGVVKQMEEKLRLALETNRETVAHALDPAAPESPVRRFLDMLKKDIEAAGDDRDKQLKELTKALDANDEESLLNRLNRDVQHANERLIKAINPENPESPMAVIRATLTKLIQQHMEENRELLEKAEERQKQFEIEVKKSLARLEKQKEEAARSTHGGLEFEDLVSTFIEEAIGDSGYIHERSGARVGLLPNRKTGDHVISFPPGHAFAGSTLVVEAKRERHYSVAKALEEIEEARRNRGSDAGVFVMATGHAPPGFPRFARYANDILVQWDPDDPDRDAYLHAAIVAGLCLVTRKARVVEENDIDAVADIEGRLLKTVKKFDSMDGHTERIQRSAEKLADDIRLARDQVTRVIRNTRKTLEALNIEARDHDAERATPIGLDDASFDAARAAVRASTEVPVAGAAFRASAVAVDEEE